jgi:hypothetical protein
MSQDISNLREIDRGQLYLFVVGPGKGEALAIALPGQGWLIIDGCRSDRRAGGALPVERILERWRRESDPVLAMVLTHPHADHVEGFAELLDTLSPRHVVVAGAGSLPTSSLHINAQSKQVKTWMDGVASKKAQRVLEAVQLWSNRNPDGLIDAVDGAEIPLGGNSLSAYVRAPSRECVEEILGGSFSNARANEASIVVEVVFGSTRLVLGGDLPWTKNGTPCTYGWESVMQRQPHLGTHHLLKVPHHGSREALHPGLMSDERSSRCWCVTPFNSSDLPSPEPGEGLEIMLSREPSIYLTALAAPLSLQPSWPHPAQVRMSEIKEREAAVRSEQYTRINPRDIRSERIPALDPLDPLWCYAVNSNGEIVERWRGRAAIEVV